MRRFADPRVSVAMQPTPLVTEITGAVFSGLPVSAVTRHWRPGEARRCGLCETGCTAHRDVCTVLINDALTLDEARFLRVPAEAATRDELSGPRLAAIG